MDPRVWPVHHRLARNTEKVFTVERKPKNKVMISMRFKQNGAILIKTRELTLCQPTSPSCHSHSGCRWARSKQCFHPHPLSLLQTKTKLFKFNIISQNHHWKTSMHIVLFYMVTELSWDNIFFNCSFIFLDIFSRKTH